MGLNDSILYSKKNYMLERFGSKSDIPKLLNEFKSEPTFEISNNERFIIYSK